MKHLIFLLILLVMLSCNTKQTVDLILYNGKIYTVNQNNDIVEAVVIKGGLIYDIGTDQIILEKYDAKEMLDLNKTFVYPGFIDAHCHFYGYGIFKSHVDLTGTRSFDEVLQKVVDHHLRYPATWVQGRGWDQTDWDTKEFPDRTKLDNLFPNTPVFIKRIDGHAALANQKALNLAGIDKTTKVEGGEIVLKDGQVTGILIDKAADLVRKIIPKVTEKEQINALLKAQEDCFGVGLTTVDDAGLGIDTIQLIDKLQKEELLKMRIYAMVNFSPNNIKYYAKNGKYKTDHLNVISIKFYGDGALGSRGACLVEPYSDITGKDHYGFMVESEDTLRKYAKAVYDIGFQMNTHCIGDSANRLLLQIYGEMLQTKNNRRWRIEHAQVVAPEDVEKFKKYDVIPSVQPTHATSDMYWAEDRLGKERIEYGYAYKQLLDQKGIIANGSDFPVESINPLDGFYAAVARKDHTGYPDSGFFPENSLSREEALKAMTIWAAYANFEEKEKGSIETGKFADLVVLPKDIMEIELEEVINLKVLKTYLGGELVYNIEEK